MADGPQSKAVFRAAEPRISLNEPAKLIVDGGKELDVVIVDTSRTGFRIRSERLFQGDLSPATLRVPRYGDFGIEIRWRRGHEAGGAFLDGAPKL